MLSKWTRNLLRTGNDNLEEITLPCNLNGILNNFQVRDSGYLIWKFLFPFITKYVLHTLKYQGNVVVDFHRHSYVSGSYGWRHLLFTDLQFRDKRSCHARDVPDTIWVFTLRSLFTIFVYWIHHDFPSITSAFYKAVDSKAIIESKAIMERLLYFRL